MPPALSAMRLAQAQVKARVKVKSGSELNLSLNLNLFQSASTCFLALCALRDAPLQPQHCHGQGGDDNHK